MAYLYFLVFLYYAYITCWVGGESYSKMFLKCTSPRKVMNTIPTHFQRVSSECPPEREGSAQRRGAEAANLFRTKVVPAFSGWNCPCPCPPPHLSHLGSHTALRLWRENKAGSQSTKTFLLSAGQQLARWPGGPRCPSREPRPVTAPLSSPQGQMFWPWASGGRAGAGQDSTRAPTRMPVTSARPRGHSPWPGTQQGLPRPPATHKAAFEQPGWCL